MKSKYFYDELGMVEQICSAETDDEIIRDRETGECINKNKSCDKCEYYQENWNLMSYINGLRWILQDDRFDFGENWDKGSRPTNEEENAGYIITRTLEYLEQLYNEHKSIGRAQKDIDEYAMTDDGK